MKKIDLNKILIGIVFLFISCEDRLDVQDPSIVPVGSFITDAATAETALLNAYNDIQGSYVAGAFDKMHQGTYSDNFNHTGSLSELTESVTNNLLATNLDMGSIYRTHYAIIGTTTEVIRVVTSLSLEQISTEERSPIIAEAHALRAYAYFELVKLFGGIPISELTVPLDGDAANNIPRSSEAEVFNYINNEIALAEGLISNSSKIRFTNEALQVLKAKVLMQESKYDAAELTLQALIGQYSLAPNYEDLFIPSNDTDETIFRINYTTADSNALSFYFFPAPEGRREVAPQQAFLDAFDASDNRINMIASNTNAADAYLIKYNDTGSDTDQPYVYRYADVLLMYAEVLARKNDPDASIYINLVRNRAGLGDVNLDSSNVVDLIADERRFEFFGEGQRWDDVKRLGIAQQVIESKGIIFDSRMLLWPIPQAEIETNDAITQADQNPGY